MKKLLIIAFIFFILDITFVYSFEITEYKVVSGDTIEILKDKSLLKIACIEAPYSDQPFYLESKNNLEKILSGGEIYADNYKNDKNYFTATILVNGRNICYEMLRGGYAWSSSNVDRTKAYSGYYSTNDNYLQYEIEARDNKVGLFALANPRPPWESKKKNSDAANKLKDLVFTKGNSDPEKYSSYAECFKSEQEKILKNVSASMLALNISQQQAALICGPQFGKDVTITPSTNTSSKQRDLENKINKIQEKLDYGY